MAGKICGLAALTAATVIVAASAFAQNPALVPEGSRPFTPPDTTAPPPRATAPVQQPAAQTNPAQPQASGTQIATPASQDMATVAPAPLLQKPAVPPIVALQNGLLSIEAVNSNLADVLNAVKRVTGATIEGGSGASERVVVHLGPGRPNDVISALLNGSRYDYVVLGSTQQPGAVTRILLSVRQAADQAAPQSAANVPPTQANNNPEDDGPQVEDSAEQREQDARGGQVEPQEPMAPPQQNGFRPPQNPQDAGAQNNEQPKTPQQLFEEIQRMQQMQQQQQNQNQNQNPQTQQYPPAQQNPQQPPPPDE